MNTFKSYDSFEEMMADIDRSLRAADDAVKPWQSSLNEGDYFLRLDGEIPIFGQIINPFQFYDDLRAKGKMNEELEQEEKWERANRAQPRLKNMRFSMCYSLYCIEGEMGDTHVASMHVKLTKEQFETAKAADWNVNLRELLYPDKK